ncbi:MAG: hypothetical protein IT487_19225 [Chromatiaceae bacterium]|nr:hypothetical protein [Chromatiaceae bacterium]
MRLAPERRVLDTLPAGIMVISPVNLTGTPCATGSVSTTNGSVSYANGAAIPPGGCVIKVQVTATVGGKYVNLLAVGDLQTNGGGNEDPAEADLYVDPADLAITKNLKWIKAACYSFESVISGRRRRRGALCGWLKAMALMALPAARWVLAVFA